MLAEQDALDERERLVRLAGPSAKFARRGFFVWAQGCGTRGFSNHFCDTFGNLPRCGRLLFGEPFLLYREVDSSSTTALGLVSHHDPNLLVLRECANAPGDSIPVGWFTRVIPRFLLSTSKKRGVVKNEDTLS